MSVGIQTNQNVLNQQLGTTAVRLRDSSDEILRLWDYVSSLGSDQAAQVAGLVAAGFSAEDAAAFWLNANYLYSVSQIYTGNMSQPSAFNFNSALANARGGQ